MHMASQMGHCGVVRMLLEAKANVHIKTNVSHAAYGGDHLYTVWVHISMATVFQLCYCFPYFPSSLTAHIPTIQDGRTAYDVASRNGHTQVCELLH